MGRATAQTGPAGASDDRPVTDDHAATGDEVCLRMGMLRRPLPPGEYSIGRDPRADISLDDPQASWHHARLTVSPRGRVVLEDLRSRNGTTVNGLAVSPGGLRSLRPGDQLAIGSQRFLLEALDGDDRGSTGVYRRPPRTERDASAEPVVVVSPSAPFLTALRTAFRTSGVPFGAGATPEEALQELGGAAGLALIDELALAVAGFGALARWRSELRPARPGLLGDADEATGTPRARQLDLDFYVRRSSSAILLVARVKLVRVRLSSTGAGARSSDGQGRP